MTRLEPKPVTGSQGSDLGTSYDGDGVHFSLYSSHAEKVELCLFDASGSREIERLQMPAHDHGIWHGYLPGAEPGCVYGYRVYGPYEPLLGHRFNHHKLLLDPYARQLLGSIRWHDALYGYCRGSEPRDLSFDVRDSAPYMPKCVVSADSKQSRAPRPLTAWQDTLLYEAHVRSLTRLHPAVAPAHQGRFAGVGSEAVLAHLLALGVTTVELMPVQQFVTEDFLLERNLSNYWGYNTLAFFAPHAAYAEQDAVAEFRAMADRLHGAGLELLLDVVFNHTAEGNELGPTLSFRGIDNRSYYKLLPNNPRYYVNESGCGNTLDIGGARVQQLVLDALRYWVSEMGVDGFRFDLAPVLGREHGDFDPHARFFSTLRQDPVLNKVKLVAEPWDVGHNGYRLGQFPAPWREWNDRYRDVCRRFWRGDAGVVGELAARLHGSSDLFEASGRGPDASINFVCTHDGFCLPDLVSYSERHNEANGEGNRDGHSDNLSSNHGVEGSSCDPSITVLRERQQRNFLATLFLSQGVPMLNSGDELGHSKGGNNNSYCQDNEINWIDWGETGASHPMIDFSRRLAELRRIYPLFSYPRFAHGHETDEALGFTWLADAGTEMTEPDWHDGERHHLTMLLSWQEAGSLQDSLLLCLNAASKPVEQVLPQLSGITGWRGLLDTCSPTGDAAQLKLDAGSKLCVESKSILLLKAVAGNKA